MYLLNLFKMSFGLRSIEESQKRTSLGTLGVLPPELRQMIYQYSIAGTKILTQGTYERDRDSLGRHWLSSDKQILFGEFVPKPGLPPIFFASKAINLELEGFHRQLGRFLFDLTYDATSGRFMPIRLSKAAHQLQRPLYKIWCNVLPTRESTTSSITSPNAGTDIAMTVAESLTIEQLASKFTSGRQGSFLRGDLHLTFELPDYVFNTPIWIPGINGSPSISLDYTVHYKDLSWRAIPEAETLLRSAFNV